MSREGVENQTKLWLAIKYPQEGRERGREKIIGVGLGWVWKERVRMSWWAPRGNLLFPLSGVIAFWVRRDPFLPLASPLCYISPEVSVPPSTCLIVVLIG